jgi:hypothetical protein
MASRTHNQKTSTEPTQSNKSSRGTSVNRVILVGRLVAKCREAADSSAVSH